jgi:hypothetical protein
VPLARKFSELLALGDAFFLIGKIAIELELELELDR